jgi:hypothetical protein
MVSRNQVRLLGDEQIEAIKKQMAADFETYSYETAEILMNYYLEGNKSELMDAVITWVEGAEDDVINQINTELAEDAFRDGGFDGIH